MSTFFQNMLIQYLIHQVSHFAKYSLDIKYLTFGCYLSWEQFFSTKKTYFESNSNHVLKPGTRLWTFSSSLMYSLTIFTTIGNIIFFSKSTPSEAFLLPFLLSLFEVFSPGYGNLTTRTALGKVSPLYFFLKDFCKTNWTFWRFDCFNPLIKVVTILYALVGIPLMFIYMANIGSILATSFKYTYSKMCRCDTYSLYTPLLKH